MPRTQLTKEAIKYEVLRIKDELNNDSYWTSDPKGLAQRYLNKVLDKIEEYRI
jgi:hypothetical protein